MIRVMTVLAVLLLSACSNLKTVSESPTEQSKVEKAYRAAEVSYFPIQPVNLYDYYQGFDYFRDRETPEFKKAFHSVEDDKAAILRLFPNETARVYIEEYDRNGKLSFGNAGISREDHTYHIVVDYLKYRTDNISDTVYVSGIGLRMRAKVTSQTSGVDLADLFALGAAASEKKLSGSLEFESIGISGPQISPLIPVPASLSPTAINASIQAFAAIKAKLYHDIKDVTVWPQIAGTVGGKPVENLQKLLSSQRKAEANSLTSAN